MHNQFFWRTQGVDSKPLSPVTVVRSESQNDLLRWSTSAAEFVASPTWTMGSRRSQEDADEYEMSVVHDSAFSSPVRASIPITHLSVYDGQYKSPRSSSSMESVGPAVCRRWDDDPMDNEAATTSNDGHRSLRKRGFLTRWGGSHADKSSKAAAEATPTSPKAKKGSRNKRHPDRWSQPQPEWSPWRRTAHVRTDDAIDTAGIAFRGAGGAVMRR